jgi:hypothetical protein
VCETPQPEGNAAPLDGLALAGSVVVLRATLGVQVALVAACPSSRWRVSLSPSTTTTTFRHAVAPARSAATHCRGTQHRPDPAAPVVACAAAAAVGALGAMSHAETTFAASLIWGAIEAIAVVAGYIVLGGRLGLTATARHSAEP